MNPQANLILQDLNEPMYQRLLPRLQRVSLNKGDILYKKSQVSKARTFLSMPCLHCKQRWPMDSSVMLLSPETAA